MAARFIAVLAFGATATFGVPISGVFSGGGSHADLEKLQGTWLAVEFSRGADKKLLPDMLEGVGLVVNGHKWYHGRLDRKHDYRKFTLNSSKNPKEVDFESTDLGRRLIIHGIYELGDSYLKIAFSPASSPRPNGFAPAPGTHPYIWLFQRKDHKK